MKPNFFIVGAPKCGTSAMYSYLQSHPAVFVPRVVKEPHHFSPEFWSVDSVVSSKDYAKLFQGATERHRAIGEASTGYILSDTALTRIHDFNPDARIILMLRDPVEMAESLFEEARFHWWEPLDDFEAAWAVQAARSASGPPVVATETDGRLQYSRCCAVGSLYQRALKSFAPEQIHVVLFDDFKANPPDAYRRLLRFLELPNDGRTDFPPVNTRRTHRFPRLMRWWMKPPEPLYSLKKRLRNALGLHAAGLGWRLVSRFTRPVPRQPLRPEFQRHLREHFAPEVELLEELLRQPLPAWKASGSRAA